MEDGYALEVFTSTIRREYRRDYSTVNRNGRVRLTRTESLSVRTLAQTGSFQHGSPNGALSLLNVLNSVKKLIESYDPNVLLSEASTPPSCWYTDPRLLELEQRTVFSRSWQMIGRAEQVREPGQYITCDFAGEPILVVRGGDGVLRGFYNVCRHHAAAVIPESQGQLDHLRCPYHGWTYNLEGALIVAPEFGGVRNFDKSINGLIPIQTAIWHGWVFVKLDSDAPTLEEFLGKELIGKIEEIGAREHSLVRTPLLYRQLQLESFRRQLPRRRLPRTADSHRVEQRSRLRRV